VPGDGDKGATCGVKRVWRRRIDIAKFENPITRLKYPRTLEPAIEEQDVPLFPERVNEILARAAALEVPARSRENVIGLDGVLRVLSFRGLCLTGLRA
jgi:hypothetical protein